MRRGKVHRQHFHLIPLLVIREGKVSYQANCRPQLFLSGIARPTQQLQRVADAGDGVRINLGRSNLLP